MSTMFSKYQFVLLFLVLMASQVVAQRKLIIAKPASPAKYTFYEGEEIRFKLKGERYWNKAFIQGLGDDYIRLHYTTIALSEIEMIDIRSRSHSYLHMVAAIGVYGGVGFIGIDQFNRSIVKGESGFDEKTMLIGGALLSTGALIYLLKRKKVKIGRKFRLRVAEY
ncbi:hypothetical protein C900_05492 [Fulvivirga imtechensis AK7]|uniref:Uncharacterized protein n=1 Tax=Fulvivirga imtechensis AK7 TaxID=1237149 RepID=L8JLH4_9BACT|nr:hypothetical protein [Fulvivirga imtechensis]ELR69103.1 hypothetical protein C900_05492 [Fulvivirga imtechensis AK7]